MSHFPPPCSKARDSGLTLLELLVALAVVGVLTALLFGTFRKVRNGSQSTACLSNLRQIGAAANLYFNEHHQIIPLQPNSEPSGWHHALAPYLGLTPFESTTARILCCPGDLAPQGKQPRTYRWNLSRNRPGAGQGVGSITVLQLPRQKRNRIALLKEPSRHAMIFDISYTGTARFDLWRNNNNSWGDTYDTTQYPPDNPGLYPRPHYENRAINILYYDGRVAAVTYPLPHDAYYWEPALPTAP